MRITTVDALARKRALLTRERFVVDGLPSRICLVRLDERGGLDEPAPWALLVEQQQPLPIWHDSTDDEDTYVDVKRAIEWSQKNVPARAPHISEATTNSYVPAPGPSDVFATPAGIRVDVDDAADPEAETALLSRPSGEWKLRIPPARGEATVYAPTSGTTWIIGRAPGSDVRIRANSVSRHHARLATAADGGWIVEDMGSSNGTRVNGYAVTGGQSRRLRVGDVIHLGDVGLMLLDAAAFYDASDALLMGRRA